MSTLTQLQKKLSIEETGIFDKNTLFSAAKHFNLSNLRAAHFFGQIAHETADFKFFTENLNYSALVLQKIFGKYFIGVDVNNYARNPEKIANRVYANRLGNGNESSGDGWRFRGRGAIQLTGKVNYQALASALNLPQIMKTPEIVADELAFESAVFFFNKNSLWSICDQGVTNDIILKLTKKINGGTLGLEDRTEKTKKYFSWFNKGV